VAALKLTTYNPQEKAIFPVSSTLISGKKEAILFDAQFSTTEGKALVELIRQSGKELTTVYITGGDPDFYFGLQPIVEAFPQVKIKATATIVDHINHTKDWVGYPLTVAFMSGWLIAKPKRNVLSGLHHSIV